AILKNMNCSADNQKDVCQAVLIQSWEKLPEFIYKPVKGKFRSWLTVVTVNMARKNFRQEGRLNKVLNSDKAYKLDEYQLETLPAEIESISQNEWERFISEKAWLNIADNLSQKVRESFEMLMKGVEPDDIARKLGINKNTVHVYKKRVSNKLCCEIVRLEKELN
ncbi:MAG: RNA polymerase sigma factor, partial [Lentisphaeraceae bacterium]|nr:RNA polymerase sigma factor [Lentisphaeraceae bacterium]